MNPEVVVAGHLCLDVIPCLAHQGALKPGTLIEVGPAAFSPGGSVANVGLALGTLGVQTELVGKVGDDAFGSILKGLLESQQPGAERSIVTSPGESTSYTVVLSPPDSDRTFLHHPGCNDTFSAADLDLQLVAQAKLCHFGYPPLMKRFYSDAGESLGQLLEEVRARGVTTSLDMAMPDPNAASGKVDWRAYLKRILPHADLFLPSFDEILFMLERPRFEAGREPQPELLYDLSEQLLEWGAGMVGLKLGDQGFYLRTADEARLARMGRATPAALAAWAERELWSPIFAVPVQGTTGAGDATIAGFLAALLKGLEPELALTVANAVGAFSVEAVEAVAGVRDWKESWLRAQEGGQREHPLKTQSWTRNEGTGVAIGPNDRRGER